MKKSLVFLIITCVIVWAAFGCTRRSSLTDDWNSVKERLDSFTDKDQKNEKNHTADNQQNDALYNTKDLEEKNDSITALDESTTKEEMQAREDLGLTDAAMEQLLDDQKGNYAYDLLNLEQQRQLYVEIYTILANQAGDIILCSTDIQVIDRIFQCVMSDHPEIFYVTGYTYTKYSVNEMVRRVAFTGTYTMDQGTIREMQGKIQEYVVQCLRGLDTTADDYHKVKYIYEYVISHTEYDLEAKENQNICSVFVYGASVCQGYAKTMQYLLNEIDIPATLVIGTVDSGEGHAWNLVQLDGDYYYVDATWGDAFYQLEGAAPSESQLRPNGEDTEEGSATDVINSKMVGRINYDYLCVTTDQLCTTHVIDNIVPMPRCIATKDNYYVREGAYFEAYDGDKVASLFQKAYDSGQGFVTLKCSDASVYQQIRKKLIEEQVVFQLLQRDTQTIAYATSEEQLTFTFWL
ncbi:MAG: transglutaminase domain-containing protein [Lachnospiraceae bacterium]|nr:transglutaminase domain-containing protein [Lachnospiraceae bacterium]